MNLSKIDKNDLILNNTTGDNITNTYLVLDDYDWMKYTLSSRFKVQETELTVEFVYYGATTSIMKVGYSSSDISGEIVYEYSTDLFQKYIIKFLTKHIAHWDNKYAFCGIDVVIDFYNEVLENGEIVN